MLLKKTPLFAVSTLTVTALFPLTAVAEQFWASGITIPLGGEFKTVEPFNNGVGASLSTIPIAEVRTNMMMQQTVSYTPKGWYDTNKTWGEANGVPVDNVLCWAATASNLIQWWVDQNKNYINPNPTFQQGFGTSSVRLGMTQYNTSKIFDTFRNTFGNISGNAYEGIGWYLDNAYNPKAWDDPNDGGFIRPEVTLLPGKLNGQKETWMLSDCLNLSGLDVQKTASWQATEIKNALSRGEAIALSVVTANSATGRHAISCWGAEYDGETLKALFITDSDDMNREVGLTRYDVAIKNDSIQLKDAAGTAVYDISHFASLSLGQDYLQIIPEPSMFALFAGTLALTLAGTRRRRK